ncbi:hypothetical protein RclHR1_25860001 [Rhizophagus clarus]|uniref:Uncharacterized protein n=1 Tax=Rhizophagus clarus TaxID=94130 RepID=A0A2Z6R478_9GLOM|nr:hypothetical protein RclHR1_25860001 [Rhizophagus clarus]GES74527.1 hypothetical protein RCL_e11182_RclHR1_25860001 [Rhizophagus clarus]
MQNQIEACFDTDRGQTQYLLNNKIYVFLTPLSENKKKIHNLIINLCVILKKLTAITFAGDCINSVEFFEYHIYEKFNY